MARTLLDSFSICHEFAASPVRGGPVGAIENYIRFDPLYKDIALYFLAEARISLGQLDEAIAALKQRLARNPNSETSYALLAACYGQLSKTAETQAAWANVMKIAPEFSIERRRQVLPFKKPEMFEYRIEGMRKAGLPV